MTYVMLVFLVYGGAVTPVVPVDFSSQETCERALSRLKAETTVASLTRSENQMVRGICTLK